MGGNTTRKPFVMNADIRNCHKPRMVNPKIDTHLNKPVAVNHADRIETAVTMRDRANLISRHMSAGSMIMADNQADAFVKLLYDTKGIVLSVMVAKILSDHIWLKLQGYSEGNDANRANSQPFDEEQVKAMFPHGDKINEVTTFFKETSTLYDKTKNLMHHSANCDSPTPDARWNVKTVTALNSEHQQILDEQSLMTSDEIMESWKTEFYNMVNRLFTDDVWQRLMDNETEQMQLLNNNISDDPQGDLEGFITRYKQCFTPSIDSNITSEVQQLSFLLKSGFTSHLVMDEWERILPSNEESKLNMGSSQTPLEQIGKKNLGTYTVTFSTEYMIPLMTHRKI